MKFALFSALIFVAFQTVSSQEIPERGQFSLTDFYDYDPDLERKVDEVFNTLNDTLIVGQLIVPAVGKHGKETTHVVELAEKGMVGGVLLLNGNVTSFSNFVTQFDSIANVNGYLRPIYSADAEPTLIRYKIKETTPVPKTNEIKTPEEVTEVAKTISKDLNAIGITQNFAPVIDASPNQTVSNRSFGLNMDTVINFSNLFIEETQNNQIIATAKHFPGHGFVQGDTHKQLVYIDGEMKEVRNYVPVIENGVLSIMVAHIAVTNNESYDTEGLPSTCSRKIVTDLLKGELDFRGLVITDAMNMGGVREVPNSGLKAIMAGCDQLLMPVEEMDDVYDILAEMKVNEDFRQQVYTSVKKIIRLKICLGIVE
ncbi:glycoside hydrolase family 3 N-terminal domain-containing protein [Parvicella tangerina]|uniref:beta-N-acetylhexosaminidase n=1 Tax=Parvicella tangerina TaxID=2829795 RepID=A0A916JLV7_9FLAO|nr:glycoside hydrolase family 3 N-terminal domain-containing protein [Parvicella tangerina]CAG5078374.1 Beta-hexosaminidase [Parvicella tangerina]